MVIFMKLKEIREDHDDTQQQIADILEVKRGTYASWECGSDIIPLKKLFQFANHYNTSIDYILNLSNDNIKVVCNNTLDISNISRNLREIRYDRKMSQYKLAESIGINQSTWWAYENEKTLITTLNLMTLCKKYNYSIDWVLNRKVNYFNEKADEKSSA